MDIFGFFGDLDVPCDIFLETVLWEDVFAEADTREAVLLRTDTWCVLEAAWKKGRHVMLCQSRCLREHVMFGKAHAEDYAIYLYPMC